MSPNNTCGWWGPHSGPVAVSVATAWPCGHRQGRSSPTCVQHLHHLLSQGGTASRATQCNVCGVTGAAKVVATHDLDGGSR
jgi:hypothetical protein